MKKTIVRLSVLFLGITLTGCSTKENNTTMNSSTPSNQSPTMISTEEKTVGSFSNQDISSDTIEIIEETATSKSNDLDLTGRKKIVLQILQESFTMGTVEITEMEGGIPFYMIDIEDPDFAEGINYLLIGLGDLSDWEENVVEPLTSLSLKMKELIGHTSVLGIRNPQNYDKFIFAVSDGVVITDAISEAYR